MARIMWVVVYKARISVRKRSQSTIMFSRRRTARPGAEAPNMKTSAARTVALLAVLACSWCCAGVKLDELRNDKSEFTDIYTNIVISIAGGPGSR